MRGIVAIALVLSTVACDLAFQLDREKLPPDAPVDASIEIDAPTTDLDNDGTPDYLDLCVAPPGDGMGTDIDGDGMFDAIDKCPYDDPSGTDTDLDGLETCDPYPNLPQNPDRSRCLMRFSNLGLNNVMWPVRMPDRPWTSEPGKLIANPPITGNTLTTTVVSAAIEGANITTYDVHLQVDPRNQYGSITIWLRADPMQPSDADIGCRYVSEPAPAGARFGVVHGLALLDTTAAMGLPAGQVVFARLRGRITTAGGIGSPASVACHVDTDQFFVNSAATLPLPPGRFGLSVDRWRVEVRALHIIDQPDP